MSDTDPSGAGFSSGFMSMRPALLHTKMSIMQARNIRNDDKPEMKDKSNIKIRIVAWFLIKKKYNDQ